MIRAYRYRLYPTKQQQAEIKKFFGCCRYAYNYYVREHKRIWNEEHRTASEFDLMNSFRAFKYDKPWLLETDSAMLEHTALRVRDGYQYFFNHINIHPPHEHKKGERTYQSYTTAGSGLNLNFRHNIVFLPKLGAVRAKIHRRFYGIIKCANVKQTSAGHYYITFYVETREPQVPMRPFDKDNAVGIDVGIRHFLTLSDGSHYEMPDMSHAVNRRAFLQRRLKMQKPGSKGYEKTKLQIARLNEHISNSRLDFHHKTAVDICSRYSAICMETFNAEQMRVAVGEKKKPKDNGFNRKLNHVGLGQFSEILEGKAERMGVHFARIDRWEPSTKRCHQCGNINKDIDLSVEQWTCPHCGAVHDRDVNAAINIRDKGLEQLPLAERNVKPAKAADISDRWTGKVAGKDVRRPSTQIEEGTALQRLATRETQYPLRPATNSSMTFLVSSSTVALLAGTSAPLVDYWAKTKVYDRPQPRQFDKIQKVINAYRQIGQEIRCITLNGNDIGNVKSFVVNLRKLVQVKKVYEEVDIHTHTFPYIYSIVGTPEFRRLMDYLHFSLPMKIDAECQRMQDNLDQAKREFLKSS